MSTARLNELCSVFFWCTLPHILPHIITNFNFNDSVSKFLCTVLAISIDFYPSIKLKVLGWPGQNWMGLGLSGPSLMLCLFCTTTYFFCNNFLNCSHGYMCLFCDGFADSSSKDGLSNPVAPHSGNGTKAQPKKVKGVGFGDIFSQGSVKLKVRLPTEVDEKKEKVRLCQSIFCKQSILWKLTLDDSLENTFWLSKMASLQHNAAVCDAIHNTLHHIVKHTVISKKNDNVFTQCTIKLRQNVCHRIMVGF